MPKRVHFFEKLDAQALAVTFDDVRLRTAHSSTDFDKSDLNTRFSRNVPLKIPVVSAAMDRVTDMPMAIGLGSLGGIGVIHRNLSIEDQAEQVRRVKLHLNARIAKPVFVRESETVQEVLDMCEKRGYSFRSFPVINSDGQLVGVLTGNNIDLSDKGATVRKAMTRNVISGGPETSFEEASSLIKKSKNIKVLPLIDANRHVVGLYAWSDIERINSSEALHNTDKNGQLVVAAAIGTGDKAFERAVELKKKNVDVVVIDTAHGDSDSVLKTLHRIKKELSPIEVVVGNVSEYDAAVRLIDVGADGIKVGQGGGSICSTRIVAGVGTPQVTAIHNCSEASRQRKGRVPVCADGGIRASGDITIAIGAGADSVMLGMMLAGTDESPGEIITHRGAKFKSYRGMGSLGAMEESEASRDRYGEKQTRKSAMVPEGVSGYVPYAGSLEANILQLIGGLKRGMGYVGVSSISELQEKADFIRITNAGIRESHPHDIEIVDN